MGELLIGLSSALVASLATLAAAWFALPKIRAEARKLNAEADGFMLDRMHAEIERLDRRVDELSAHESENRQLRQRVAELESRLTAMESVLADVFKIEPNSSEFIDLLKQVDEAEAKIKREARKARGGAR